MPLSLWVSVVLSLKWNTRGPFLPVSGPTDLHGRRSLNKAVGWSVSGLPRVSASGSWPPHVGEPAPMAMLSWGICTLQLCIVPCLQTGPVGGVPGQIPAPLSSPLTTWRSTLVPARAPWHRLCFGSDALPAPPIEQSLTHSSSPAEATRPLGTHPCHSGSRGWRPYPRV